MSQYKNNFKIVIYHSSQNLIIFLGYLWFQKILKKELKKSVKENGLLMFDFTMKNTKENEI